jgi:hypothetical protein
MNDDGRAHRATGTTQDVHPRPITPTPEHVTGPVFPYRGQETHGVSPVDKWSDVPVHETVDVEYPDRAPEQEPIPVRIVTADHGEQIRRTRISRLFAGTLKGELIAGLNRARTQLNIRNCDAVRTVYITDEPNSVSEQFGYPILPGGEFKTTTQMELYCQVDDHATQVALAIQQDFSSDS